MRIAFTGRGTPITEADFAATAETLGGDIAALWAILIVETDGFGYLADRRPQIRFERHVFHRRTGGAFSRHHPDISNPVKGGYRGGTGEYDRLSRAMALSEAAALESASWGLGQVMGLHAVTLGYGDVHEMVAAMVAGEAAQLRGVCEFIRAAPVLDAAFRARRWATLALHYNGRGYRAVHYDTKLAKHYAAMCDPLRRPDFDLRAAQACLLYLGHLRQAEDVDGMAGPETLAAVARFRAARGLPEGGRDAAMMAALREAADI